MAHRPVAAHSFWRDPALPFLEARQVADGRDICYGLHSHPTFSIGAVTNGRSSYRNGRHRHDVEAGAVVLMNPEEAHACNPLRNAPWSYRMLYVDLAWLREMRGAADFIPYAAVVSTDPDVYRSLERLFDMLFDTRIETLAKECAAAAFFGELDGRLERIEAPAAPATSRLDRAADFITEHCTRRLRLREIADVSGLSPSYLVRAFRARYGMTPHAYQLNRRIQFGQSELRRGRPIVDVALSAGFADQAHFQRVFKQHVAATPRQYARPAP
ncbi:helix-turn-helix transcriptional regulator [Sinorhizobium americanum]|uniref:AraC family transcriptional regulator n=1 Tax=Sinorhizobium americanum TaxID=194963 RepID=A0A1L3LUP8_9HYPH|nr:AraC family transcriptional regulator [Sinorhizobium americanum]APG93786.1 AraC family transcriptional regulator [Sinorhizobium americanum]OAP46333.1 AraC family transcriptional regulator [Sinorhizobium americanum]